MAEPTLVQQVPVEHRREVLDAGVNGWHPSLAAGSSTSRMAHQLRTALDTSFVASEEQKYEEAVLFGITLAWGMDITALDLTSAQSHVSFAICDQLLGVHTIRPGLLLQLPVPWALL